jgi:hypothetical protein
MEWQSDHHPRVFNIGCFDVGIRGGSDFFRVEIKLKEEKVYVHLDKEKEHDDGTLILFTWVINHLSGS